MTLPFSKIASEFGLAPFGVIHVGAHHGQEYQAYKDMGIKDIVFIEPCTPAFEVLENSFGSHSDVKLFKLACGDKKEQAMMNVEIANQGLSNSLRKPKDHLFQYPTIKFPYNEFVQVDLLDNLAIDRQKYNMLYMDTQGYEDLVLKGGAETLKYVDLVYTEVSNRELYEGCPMIEDIDKMLTGAGFERIALEWTGETWGDAVYKRVKAAVWLSKPISLCIENKTTSEAKCILFNALESAFDTDKLENKAMPVSVMLGGVPFTYPEIVRYFLSNEVSIGRTHVTIANTFIVNSNAISVTVLQKKLFLERSTTTVVLEKRTDDLDSLNYDNMFSDEKFNIDLFTIIEVDRIPALSKIFIDFFVEKARK